MTDIAYPYRVVSSDSLVLDGWYESGASSRLQFKRSWDYMTDVTLTAQLRGSARAIFSDCGIPLNRMVLNIFRETGAGAFRERTMVFSQNLASLFEGSSSPDLTVTLRGSEMAGTLILHSDLILKERFRADDPLAANVPGSRLWSETRTIRLEGNVGRFPMAMVPFSKTFPNQAIAESPWYLSWEPSNMAQPLAGSALLYLNEECAWLKNAIERKDPMVIAIMTADAVSCMVESVMLKGKEMLEGLEELPEEAAITVLVNSIRPIARGNNPEEILESAVQSIPLLKAKLMSRFMMGLA